MKQHHNSRRCQHRSRLFFTELPIPLGKLAMECNFLSLSSRHIVVVRDYHDSRRCLHQSRLLLNDGLTFHSTRLGNYRIQHSYRYVISYVGA